MICIYVHVYNIMIMTYSLAANLSIKKLHRPRPSSSLAAATFRPMVGSLAVINSWVMILGQFKSGKLYINIISIYLFLYFKWNHNGHQFCELILIKQRSLDGKGWFDWRKLFKIIFVNGGSKRNLLGTAMIVDAFLETVRTSTHLVEFDHFKHGNCAYSSLVTRWFDSSRCHWNNACSDEKFAQSFVSKEAHVGSDGWYMFVVCTDVSFHIYKDFFSAKECKGCRWHVR